MAKSSRPPKDQKKSSRSTQHGKNESTVRNSRATVSGPAQPDGSGAGDVAAEKAAVTRITTRKRRCSGTARRTLRSDIINAFRFELSRVQVPAIRERMVSGLMNVATKLAEAVAAGLGMRDLPAPMPKVMTREVTPEVTASPALSLFARPGDGSVRTRRIAILLADGCDGAPLTPLAEQLTDEGAVPRFVSTTLGSVQPAAGDEIEVNVSLEAAPAVLYDALVLPDGAVAIEALKADGRTLEFIKDQYRHCKPMLILGASSDLFAACGIDTAVARWPARPWVDRRDRWRNGDGELHRCHREASYFARETDPPRV
jgi:catalase